MLGTNLGYEISKSVPMQRGAFGLYRRSAPMQRGARFLIWGLPFDGPTWTL